MEAQKKTEGGFLLKKMFYNVLDNKYVNWILKYYVLKVKHYLIKIISKKQRSTTNIVCVSALELNASCYRYSLDLNVELLFVF